MTIGITTERISELCAQFKLPTVGTEAVNRFTKAGHGDALDSLLEVLEMEAEDRRPATNCPAATSIQTSCGQNMGYIRA